MTVSTRNKTATSRAPTASTARTTYRHGDLHRALLDANRQVFNICVRVDFEIILF